MIRNAHDLMDTAKSLKGAKTVSVAMANDSSVLKAVVEARNEGIIDAILVGDKNAMHTIADKEGFSLDSLQIIDETDEKNGSRIAVEQVLNGNAQFLMKGFVKTATLLKAILSEHELREKDVLSHVAVLDIPGRDRLFFFTDGGMIIKPDANQKPDIASNMIDLAHSMEIKPFSFGFLRAFDTDIIPENETICKQLKEKINDINAYPSVSTETALTKLDGMIASTIEECNTITKGLTIYTDTVFAGLIMGARVPICLVSRADSTVNKKASLALGAVYSNWRSK